MAISRNSTQDATASESQKDQVPKPLEFLMTTLQASCLNHHHMPHELRLAAVEEGCDWLSG